MGRLKRQGYVFTWYPGDHAPPHIHVYKDGNLICRWTVNNERFLTGKGNRKLSQLLRSLKEQGEFKILDRKQ